MHTLVITVKGGMPIFPYSIRCDKETIYYKTYDNDMEWAIHVDNIYEIKLISIDRLNSCLRHI